MEVIKYAVYADNGSGESLQVVRDTHEQAKQELEALKATAAKASIRRARVENFGKENEKTLEQHEVEKWEKPMQPTGSSQYAVGKEQPNGGQGDLFSQPPVNGMPPVNAPPVQQPATVPEPPKEDWLASWLKRYGTGGSFTGMNYLTAWEAKKEEEKKDEDESENESADSEFDENYFKSIEDELSEAKVKNMKREGNKIEFETSEETKFKQVIKILAKTGAEFGETEENKFKIEL